MTTSYISSKTRYDNSTSSELVSAPKITPRQPTNDHATDEEHKYQQRARHRGRPEQELYFNSCHILYDKQHKQHQKYACKKVFNAHLHS